MPSQEVKHSKSAKQQLEAAAKVLSETKEQIAGQLRGLKQTSGAGGSKSTSGPLISTAADPVLDLLRIVFANREEDARARRTRSAPL